MPDNTHNIVTDNDELVAVYVPKRLVKLVYALVVEGESDARVLKQLVEDRNSAVYSETWSSDLVWQAYAESGKPMKRVLKRLAEAPDQRIVSDELARAIGPGAEWPNLAGTLGAFGRRVRTRYGQARPFFESTWDPQQGKMVYWMPPEFAEVIASHEGEPE